MPFHRLARILSPHHPYAVGAWVGAGAGSLIALTAQAYRTAGTLERHEQLLYESDFHRARETEQLRARVAVLEGPV